MWPKITTKKNVAFILNSWQWTTNKNITETKILQRSGPAGHSIFPIMQYSSHQALSIKFKRSSSASFWSPWIESSPAILLNSSFLFFYNRKFIPFKNSSNVNLMPRAIKYPEDLNLDNNACIWDKKYTKKSTHITHSQIKSFYTRVTTAWIDPKIFSDYKHIEKFACLICIVNI